jgi:hypothetical protein
MAQPVWVLSVDLQTKTATFQSGMAEAAKSARGAFTEIKSGSGEMGREVSGNMMEARHGVMILGEEFGVHLPRALTTFIAGLGPISAAMEAAFPFLAIALGATLLLEHLQKLKQEGQELTQDQVKFGTAVQNAFNSLDQKLLQAQIRTDELRNNHIGALHKQLQLINMQSMAELQHQFEEVARTADATFAKLQSHWYTFGVGGSGAKNSLETFKNEYDSLVAKGDDKGASNLLNEKIAREERLLSLQKQANEALAAQKGKAGTDIADQLKYAQATEELAKSKVGHTEDEVKAQVVLVGALNEQLGIAQRLANVKNQDSTNAKLSDSNAQGAMQAEAARQAAEHTQKMGELSLAAEREQASVSLSLHQATIAERLASDINLADKEYQIQLTANEQLISALDKGGKDYQNQLKGLQDKTEELTAQHQNTLASLTGKASEEQYRKDLQDLEQNERAKIDATQQGSLARLAALDASIKNEASLNLQDTSHYRELLTARVEAARESALEEAKQAEEAGKQAAENTEKAGEMSIAAEKEATALRDSARRTTDQQRMTEELQFANEETALKMTALQQQIAALDKGGKDYENKLRELQDKQKQLVQEHENEITAIRDKAEMQRNSRILSADQSFNNTIAAGLTQVLMGHKSFASVMNSIGDQVVSGMIQNSIKSIMANDMTKESDAAAAARKAFLTGESIPVVGVVMGPVLAAAAFAGVMAFADGTDSVPGVGHGDSVPALLTPGEGVVPGGVMDGLRNMVRSGNMGQGDHYHAHVNPTYNLQALDSSGMSKLLDKHSDTLNKHVANTLRKMNKG